MLKPGEFERWKEEEAMRLVCLLQIINGPSPPEKSKSSSGTPREKILKLKGDVRSLQSSEGENHTKLFSRMLGKKFLIKWKFSENHVFFYMNCGNIFLLTLLFLGNMKALYAESSSLVV